MSGAQAGLSGRPAPQRNWALAGYGVALVIAATVLVVGEPRGSAWSVYGLAGEVLGVGCLLRGGGGHFAQPARGLRRLLARSAVLGHNLRTAAPAATRTRPRAGGLGTTQLRVIRSEWTKFVSLRSSRVGPMIAVFSIVGSALLVAATTPAGPDGSGAVAFDPGVGLLVGVELAPLALGVVGVLVITADYATGLIRSTLTVVPTRMPVLWAKLLVVVAAVVAIAVVATPVGVLLGVAELRARGWSIDPADSRFWTTACWATLYMVLVAMIGLSLGALLRTTASAISALVGVFFGVPILVHLLPEAGARWIGPYLPAEAGEAIWAHPHDWHIASRPAALIVFLGWSAALFAAASFRLLSQDV